MARQRRTAEESKEKPEAEATPQEEQPISVSRVEQAMEIYNSIMSIPNEVKIGRGDDARIFLIYPKPPRHIGMLGKKLIDSAKKFETLKTVGAELFSGADVDSVELARLLAENFFELFDLLVSMFAIILCNKGKPEPGDLSEIEEFLNDHLTIPEALLVFTIFLEQNSLSPFGQIFKRAAKEITF